MAMGGFLGEAVLSALLQATFQGVFERVVPRNNFTEFLLDKLPNDEDNMNLFGNLETRLVVVKEALSDAVEKQLPSQTNRKWIERLADAVNGTADLLDEIYSKLLAKSQSSGQSALLEIIQKSKGKLEKMTKSLHDIVKLKDVPCLKKSSSKKKSSRLESTSLLDQSEAYYGREDDISTILKFLVEEPGQRDGKDIPIIAIIGMAGIGKTSLARRLFNDSNVESRFSPRVWVHVSENMDVLKVTKTLYEKVIDQTSNTEDLDITENVDVLRMTRTLFKKVDNQTSDTKDLDALQCKLDENLKNKQFLFVFDDVWNKHRRIWDDLHKALKSGAPESRIIVTTRSQEVASTMRASQTHHLRPLNDEYCWSLFAKQAFPHTDAPPGLKPTAQEKCGGLPLVAKELGSLLCSKDAKECENILKGCLFDLPNDKIDILACFRLSFDHLSSPFLKECFAYCSIFPKGYRFDKEKLILLWMAQGFLLQLKSEGTMEEVGITYFKELLANSFFQQASDDDKSRFVMHDLINELAQFTSVIQSCLVEEGKPPNVSNMTRHVSYKCKGGHKDGYLAEVLRKAKNLWTFLPLRFSNDSTIASSSIGAQVIKELRKQKRLRVLSLSYQKDKLPDELGKLRHLRYLDLSDSAVVELPERISTLYTLQTLILSGCINLKRLPKKMPDLIYLRHLNLTGTRALQMMPPAFGKLKSLLILTNFVVSDDPKASSIKELGDLLLLRGKLSILGLQNVRDGIVAENANLTGKKDVKELEFKWSSNGRHDQEEVLEKLRPHEDIEELSIAGYGGTRLPNWLGDSSFSKMVILRLSDCRNCSSLPSLGQLSSLRQLHVENMPNCEGWLSSPVPGGVYLSLPLSLQTLTIKNCVKLTPHTAWGLRNMTSLTDLSIDCAYDNVFSFPDDDLLPASLTNLRIMNFKVLKTLNLNGLRDLTLLKSLLIKCNQLEILSGDTLPLSLAHLSITGCASLTDNCQGNYREKISHISDKIINGIDLY